MKPNWKRISAWLIVVVGFLGVILSYWAIWVLIAYFVSGVIWFADLALFLSGPVSGVGAMLSYRKPRQKLAMLIGILGLIFWVLLLVLFFTLLGFRFG